MTQLQAERNKRSYRSENSASLHILSTEGRGVGLCWAHSQPKGPKEKERQRSVPGLPDRTAVVRRGSVLGEVHIQGYLAHKKTLTPLGPPKDPRHRPTVGS